jgi:hypothetical protein
MRTLPPTPDEPLLLHGDCLAFMRTMPAASVNLRGPAARAAPSRLWCAWSKAVEWRAAALGHVTEAKPARASGRVEARSGTGRHERASERLRAELAGGKAR